MKKTLKLTSQVVIVSAVFFALSSFTPDKKAKKQTPFTAYSVSLLNKSMIGTNEQWTWSLTNTNPGNGSNGTLQDVSHWDIALTPQAEAALVAAEYSFDGVNWFSL